MVTATQLNPVAPKPAPAAKPAADPRPSPAHEAAALSKLREAHRDEYDFYLKRAREAKTANWEALPDYPIKIQAFCLSDYINAALEQAEYEPDDEVEVIVASVPGLPVAFTQADTIEEAREYLADAIEGNVLIDLQMGRDIPPVPDSDIEIKLVTIE